MTKLSRSASSPYGSPSFRLPAPRAEPVVVPREARRAAAALPAVLTGERAAGSLLGLATLRTALTMPR